MGAEVGGQAGGHTDRGWLQGWAQHTPRVRGWPGLGGGWALRCPLALTWGVGLSTPSLGRWVSASCLSIWAPGRSPLRHLSGPLIYHSKVLIRTSSGLVYGELRPGDQGSSGLLSQHPAHQGEPVPDPGSLLAGAGREFASSESEEQGRDAKFKVQTPCQVVSDQSVNRKG